MPGPTAESRVPKPEAGASIRTLPGEFDPSCEQTAVRSVSRESGGEDFLEHLGGRQDAAIRLVEQEDPARARGGAFEQTLREREPMQRYGLVGSVLPWDNRSLPGSAPGGGR